MRCRMHHVVSWVFPQSPHRHSGGRRLALIRARLRGIAEVQLQASVGGGTPTQIAMRIRDIAFATFRDPHLAFRVFATAETPHMLNPSFQVENAQAEVRKLHR